MKNILLITLMIVFSISQSMAQKPIRQSDRKDTLNRVERSKQTYEKLFQQVQSVSGSNDHELMTILQRFIFGEVFYVGSLGDTAPLNSSRSRHSLP